MYGMHNRAAEPERTPAGDYYVVVSEYRTFHVTPDTAARIGRELERRWWGPRWLKFTDVSGSRIWVLRAQVQAVMESTERQRERDRLFFRAMRREEEEAEQEWGED